MADKSSSRYERRVSFSGRLFSRVIDYPWLCGLLLIGVSAFAVGGYVDPSWLERTWAWVTGTPLKAEQVDEGPGVVAQRGGRNAPQNPPRRRGRLSGGRSDAVLVIKTPSLFSVEGATAFRAVVDAVRALDVVASANSLDEAPPLNIFGLAEPVLPRGHATAQRFEASRKKAVEHPLVVGQYISPDAQTVLVEIQYDWIFVQRDEDCVKPILDAANSTASTFSDVPMEFHVTGAVPFRLMVSKNNRDNEMRYQIIGYSMILGMAILLFRGIAVVAVVAAVPVLGVFWTLGILRYFDWQDNPFSFVILPVLLSLIGFAEGVHMMIHLRKDMLGGADARTACKHTLESVGLACFLTMITTVIGMGSLSLSRHEVVQEFGKSCILGSILIWISVMLVIPLMSTTRWSRRFSRGAERDFLDRNLERLGPMVQGILRRDRFVSYLAIAIAIVLLCISLTLRPDDRKSSSLPTGSDIQRSMAHLDKAMGGLEVCNVMMHWDPEQRTEAQILETLDEVEALLQSEPLIGHPLSVVRLLNALPGEGTAAEKASMIEILPPPLKQFLWDPKEGMAKVTFRCQDLGTAIYKPTFERLENGLKAIEKNHTSVTLEMQGDAIWRWQNLYKIVTDLMTSLGSAALEILVVLTIAYRSIRIGLIAIIPNLYPLLGTAAFMVATGIPLEITSVCCFTICLAIAVDDTIHFMSRYKEECASGKDRSQAIQDAFQGVGTGMVMTTIVLVAGFSSVLTSDTRDHRIFAILGIITLLIALLCDMLLLPALISYFDRSASRQPTSEEPPLEASVETCAPESCTSETAVT